MSMGSDTHTLRVFVATWNVGGKIPHSGLDLNEFLQLKDQSDIYVLGFQEIVPLNAGNVLVIEDNEPAVKWLSLINQALNKGPWLKKFNFPNTSTENEATCSSNASITKSLAYKDPKPTSGLLFFQKPSLKSARRRFRIVRGRQLKSCNCPSDLTRKYSRDSCFNCPEADEDNSSSEEDDSSNNYMDSDISPASITNQLKYSLIASKQMVGIFLTVWVRKELVPHIGHLKLSCIGRGILGYLGNKGCISVRFSLHQTTFCFVCSHLASGEKEGDELKRNHDVIEILKNTQFARNCKVPGHRIPEKILEHDRVIWLGDVNYRIALTYSETQKLLKKKEWDALLDKDQLKIEREAGRAFKGWEEGKIEFPPTYKYSDNSDSYAGDTLKTKKKRRTPAWCDRILWHGNGIKQLFYVRGELRFSDHRPVCAVFVVEISTNDGKMKNGSPMNVEVQHISPPMGRYLELCGL